MKHGPLALMKLRASALKVSRHALEDVSPHAHPVIAQLCKAAADQGKTLLELENGAGLAHSVLSGWKNGRRDPRLTNIAAAAQLLGFEIALVPKGDR